MNDTRLLYREVRMDDDFEAMEQLSYKTIARAGLLRPGMSYRRTNFKGLLFPETDDSRGDILKHLPYYGFVAERNGCLVALMTVGISPDTHNGYVHFGCDDEREEKMVSGLLTMCMDVVKRHGGNKLFKGTLLQPGQIRNEEFKLWEREGFVTDGYYHVMMANDRFREWNGPDRLLMDDIAFADIADIARIFDILDEDREYYLAEEYRSQYPDIGPNHLFFTLKDNRDGEIKAVSYCKIWEHRGDALTVAFGVHFRPQYEISREDTRRFITATLAAIKQMKAERVWLRASSRHFTTIVLLASEGFDFLSPHEIQLVKSI
ncbi:hypothetical protein [Cohnella yongneupensis]|uniref:N-acetyltransferase domain-containing protein n=1 Tax=Cohnella yongneupensis TaxID=425006 RepID=A0ABW0QY94_9BACL